MLKTIKIIYINIIKPESAWFFFWWYLKNLVCVSAVDTAEEKSQGVQNGYNSVRKQSQNWDSWIQMAL
jgi:hypothetical protein